MDRFDAHLLTIDHQTLITIDRCNLLGLQALHEITSSGSYRLRVDLEDWEGNTANAEYS